MISRNNKIVLILSLVFMITLLGFTSATSQGVCNLELTKTVDKETAQVGDVLTYTLHYKNTGEGVCDGYDIPLKNTGVLIKDYLDDNFLYERVHSESVLYDTDLQGISYSSYASSYTDYTGTVRTAHWLNWNANVVSPGEEGTITFQVRVLEPLECGNFEIANYFQAWSREDGWMNSSTIYVSVNNECPQPYCGDNNLDAGEECDDGNNVNGDGCSSICITEETPYQNYCGDGIIYFPFEICDDGNDNGKVCTPEYGESCSYCKTNCKPLTLKGPYCGDNIKNGLEQCDGTDGVGYNQICNSACKLTNLPVCGNHVLESGEQCDDGNNVNGDGCSSVCNIEICPPEPYCGDNNLDAGEQCDDGNNVNGDGCSAVCVIEQLPPQPVCGNHVLESGEQCDDGNNVNGDGCSSVCNIEICPPEPYCGDNNLDAGEQCDDGNNVNGDGCSAVCVIEQLPPQPVCGNHVLESGEQCDDGNNVNGDGCSAMCRTEGENEDKDYTKINHFVQYCDTSWECTGWSECINGAMTRTCLDTNHCEIEYNKPYEQTGCNVLSNAYVEEGNTNTFWIILGIILFIILLIILINLL